MARTTIERSIDIDVPAVTAYNQWTQFEDFPSFMDGVDAVEQLDDRRLRWRAHVGPKQVEWDAEIVEQRPDTLIAWRSTSGAENSGVVRFVALGSHQTRVQLTLAYAPEGFFELLGAALGAVTRRVEGDLERFKTFIETRGTATGGWRGAIFAGTPTQAGDGTGASTAPQESLEGPGLLDGPPQPPPSTHTLRVRYAPQERADPASERDARDGRLDRLSPNRPGTTGI